MGYEIKFSNSDLLNFNRAKTRAGKREFGKNFVGSKYSDVGEKHSICIKIFMIKMFKPPTKFFFLVLRLENDLSY